MRLDKSIIVQGTSIDDALLRAADQFHASASELAYEVLQHGLVDHNGLVKIPYKLRVTSLVSPPPIVENVIAEHDIQPPFTLHDLTTWTSVEFLRHLESAVSGQPGSGQTQSSNDTSPSVEPFIINYDINSTHPPITHAGDVIIRGHICRGVHITSGGSIIVYGDVDEAVLIARHNITIDGDLVGALRAEKGSATCRFTQGAFIECADRLTVHESAYHSRLISGSDITVGNSVVGGHVSAPVSISARVFGSETGVTTRVFSGRNSRVREEAEQVRRQAHAIVTRLSQTTRDIKHYSAKEFVGTSGTVEERMKLWAAMSEKVWLNDQLVALSKRKSALLSSIDKDRSAKITVIDKVHPQTQIEIDDVGTTVKKLTQFVTFTKDYEAGALRVTSLR